MGDSSSMRRTTARTIFLSASLPIMLAPTLLGSASVHAIAAIFICVGACSKCHYHDHEVKRRGMHAGPLFLTTLGLCSFCEGNSCLGDVRGMKDESDRAIVTP